MPSTLRPASLCPAPLRRPTRAAGLPDAHRPPGSALSLTLPGAARSVAVARAAVASALHAHGLDAFAFPAVQASSELVAVATRLTPADDVYLSLRQRDDALRLVVWDQHPRHADPVARSVCEDRRLRALWLLAAVVDDWGGKWGVCGTESPHRGTKSWALLPR